MKVILLTDVKKVGQRGSVVTVADGYAQNVLIPKKLARLATADVLKQVEGERKSSEAKAVAEKEETRKLVASVDGKSVDISARVNDAGGLFESIHARQIATALSSTLGVSMPEEAIKLEEPIKKAGQYEVQLSLKDAKGMIYVSVHS